MNYQAYKNRQIDFSQRVEIYRNLHNGLWSVRQNGLVVAHLESFRLEKVSFKVLEAGRQRVLKEKKKNVHAFICGLLVESMINFITPEKEAFHLELVEASKLSYNPYKSSYFKMINAHGEREFVNSKECRYNTLFLLAGKAGIAAIM